LIMRFVGQRSRSQLLKIEQKFDTFFDSARYIKNEMSDLNETWYKAFSSHHLACVYHVSFRSDISFLRYCAKTIVPPGPPNAIHHIDYLLISRQFHLDVISNDFTYL
jgi:hypothetical protein